MESPWAIIEGAPEAAAALTWKRWLGPAFNAVAAVCLRDTKREVNRIPCENGCECNHRVRKAGEFLVGRCDCDEDCPDIPLTKADVAVWEFSQSRFGRTVAKVFECDTKDVELGVPGARQVAAFGNAALPVVMVIQHDAAEFASVVRQLIGQFGGPFILLTPTNRFWDGTSQGLLKKAKAGLFDLESNLILLASGKLHAPKKGGELFSPYLPTASEPASDDEARRLFALLKALESESNYRKAPVTRVFQLYCLESESRNAVATACRCVPSLVTLRLKAIEKKLGRKPRELRSLSDQFERIADSLADPRARRIDRGRAIEGDDPDNED
jgi:hypothetical protein